MSISDTVAKLEAIMAAESDPMKRHQYKRLIEQLIDSYERLRR